MKAPQRILRRTVSYCVISSKYLTAVRPSFTCQNQTYPRCPTIRSPPPSPTSPPPYPHGRFSRHIRFTPCIALIYAPPACTAPPTLFLHDSHHSVGLHLPVSRLCHPASPSAAYASIPRCPPDLFAPLHSVSHRLRAMPNRPAPPARYALFDPHPRRRAIVNSHPIFIFLCALVSPCLSAPPRITPSSVYVLVPLPHRFSPSRRFCQHPLSLPQNFLHSPVSRLALGSIIPLTRRIALSSSDELRRAATLSLLGRPLSPLDAHLPRAQVRSLSFLSLSCAFLLVPQCSQHPFFSLCSMIAYFLRRENT